MKVLLVIFFVLASLKCLAGNGSSGGGNIYGDQLNPWFVHNTKSVSYCVDVSPDFSKLSREKINELVLSAINYWKNLFRDYDQNFAHDFEFNIRLGTQDFLFHDECNEITDLRFQLGHLKPKQLKLIPNFKQLLGIALRESYDPVHLKGKGFIYIAPEEGTLRPYGHNLHKNPWSTHDGISLRYALIHELGHIFGLPDDHYSHGGIMHAKFLERVASKIAVAQNRTITDRQISSPFGCNQKLEGEMNMHISRVVVPPTNKSEADELEGILQLPSRFKLEFKSINRRINIKVNNMPWGEIELSRFTHETGNIAPAISLYLTKSQKVLPRVPRQSLYTYLDLYHMNKTVQKKDLTLKLANGKSLNVFLNFDQECRPTLGTTFKDNVFLDLFTEI